MISRYFEARSGASFLTSASSQAVRRLDAIGGLPLLAGLLLAAGFVILLAGRHEAQLIRAECLQQEVIGR
ncbi:hypothetical protein FHT78_000098 [Rhizobium sp. BK196]|uniref:hypothetical protein n=1 Tax=Rhizobium sp. BK196 TaxID=2587073 RepID=UPI00161A14BA|nr:hypothetical protein [Rhizobium sp. BK196]MBB3308369.1 hypothetical protein [Rhizobium sp. BK196]